MPRGIPRRAGEPHICCSCGDEYERRSQTETLCAKCRREYMLEYNARPHVRRRIKDNKLRKKFGICLDQYEQMLADQGGVCAVCHRPETEFDHRGSPRCLAVDHCHTTGQVRGLLCGRCNKSIGLAGDNPDRLRAMARYLEG